MIHYKKDCHLLYGLIENVTVLIIILVKGNERRYYFTTGEEIRENKAITMSPGIRKVIKRV